MRDASATASDSGHLQYRVATSLSRLGLGRPVGVPFRHMSDVLRPTAANALQAWRHRVSANREQAERVREGTPPRDFYAAVASDFLANPRRTDEPALDLLRSLASAFMGTDLQFRQRLGIPLPEGVAIDEHGRPTTDAAAARRGAILPFGGHKGYALARASRARGPRDRPAHP